MMKILNIAIFAAVPLVSACSFMHDADVVARVGEAELSRDEVEWQIPKGLSGEDSLKKAAEIIDAWALARIVEVKLSESLSEEDKNLTREIEEYRNSLLRFRFEKNYVSGRLDTVVTEDQLKDYYEEKGKLYALEFPIMKVRIFRLPQHTKDRDDVLKMLSAGKDDDILALKEMAARPECSYTDYDGRWVSAVQLAKDYGMDYGSLLAKKDSRSFMVFTDEQGEEILIYVAQMVGYGKIPPLEYCREDIKEAILGYRKNELSKNMEQDLLSEAVANGEYEKYGTEHENR